MNLSECENKPSEMNDGLRTLEVITRNLPNIEFEKLFTDAGFTVEASRGIWIISKPSRFQPKQECNEGHPLYCADCGVETIHKPAPTSEQRETSKVEEKIAEIYAYHHDGHVLKETASLDQRLRELVRLVKEEK